MNEFAIPTTFATIPIGAQFVEVMTTCNEVATRIEPTAHQDKPVNARRVGGKLIFMAEWEPVFVDEWEDAYFHRFFWECPECDAAIHISWDYCFRCNEGNQ